MTNPAMVKRARPPQRATDPKLPEPNVAAPQLLPATEGDPAIYTTVDPTDSPQPRPEINQHKTKGLQARR